MPNATVDPIIARTLAEIDRRLTPIHNNPNVEPTAAMITAALRDPIYDAFAATNNEDDRTNNEDDRRYLYRQMSLKFHPDRLHSSRDAFAIKLNTIINRIQPNGVRTTTEAETLRTQLKQIGQQFVTANQEVPTFSEFMANPTGAGQTLFNIFQAKLANFFNEYERYPQPLRGLIFVAQAVVNTGLILAAIALVVAMIVVAIPISIYESIEKGLLHLILGQSYKALIDAELTPPKIAAFCRKQFSTAARDLSEDSDEDVITFAKTQFRMGYLEIGVELSDEELEDKIKKAAESELTGFSHINLILKAAYGAVTAPGNAGFFLNNLYRALVIVTVFPLIAADLALNVAKTVVTAGVLASIVFLTAIKIGVTLAINTPLYVYDALAALYNYVFGGAGPGAGSGAGADNAYQAGREEYIPHTTNNNTRQQRQPQPQQQNRFAIPANSSTTNVSQNPFSSFAPANDTGINNDNIYDLENSEGGRRPGFRSNG